MIGEHPAGSLLDQATILGEKIFFQFVYFVLFDLLCKYISMSFISFSLIYFFSLLIYGVSSRSFFPIFFTYFPFIWFHFLFQVYFIFISLFLFSFLLWTLLFPLSYFLFSIFHPGFTFYLVSFFQIYFIFFHLFLFPSSLVYFMTFPRFYFLYNFFLYFAFYLIPFLSRFF